MKRFWVIAFIFIAGVLWAQSSLESFIKTDLVPRGYALKDWAQGDLNRDGAPDLAVAGDDKDTQQRVLWIFTNANGNYHLALKNETALYNSEEGGVMGDPWSDISVKKNSLFFSFYGGSSWRWGASYQFQYRKDGWYWIGHDSESFHVSSGEGEKHSYNLLNGKHQIIESFSDGTTEEKWEQKKKKPLIRLIDFKIEKTEEYLK